MRTLVNVLATCSIILWVFMVIGLATSYILKYYILGWPGSGFIAGVVASYKGFVSRYAKIDPASGRSFPI
jgi:hypothetical protein